MDKMVTNRQAEGFEVNRGSWKAGTRFSFEVTNGVGMAVSPTIVDGLGKKDRVFREVILENFDGSPKKKSPRRKHSQAFKEYARRMINHPPVLAEPWPQPPKKDQTGTQVDRKHLEISPSVAYVYQKGRNGLQRSQQSPLSKPDIIKENTRYSPVQHQKRQHAYGKACHCGEEHLMPDKPRFRQRITPTPFQDGLKDRTPGFYPYRNGYLPEPDPNVLVSNRFESGLLKAQIEPISEVFEPEPIPDPPTFFQRLTEALEGLFTPRLFLYVILLLVIAFIVYSLNEKGRLIKMYADFEEKGIVLPEYEG
jgi:hypothetical protein